MLAFLAWAVPTIAWGQKPPLGPEFQVNTYTYSRQAYPAVAAASNGNFVVVWQSEYQDGDGWGIFGEPFGEGGATTTTTAATSTTTTTLPWGCAATPKIGCRQQTEGGRRRGKIVLKNKSPDARDRVVWKWVRGYNTDRSDFGNPMTETDYALCLYDTSADTQPRLQARAPAGGTCAGYECWRELGARRVDYSNRYTDPDGLYRVSLRAGHDGGARIQVWGKGVNLDMPTMWRLRLPVTVQLQASNDKCWEAEYRYKRWTPDPDVFKANPVDPDCNELTAPACNGYCPGGKQCTEVGSSCVCGTPCADSGAPSCNGGCPAGLQCGHTGSVCECLPPCGNVAAPECNGACPAWSECNPVGSLCACAMCGNFYLETGEECDDGNQQDGDGCSSQCLCNPATTPGVCNLTGDWVSLPENVELTIAEDTLGNLVYSGTWGPTWGPIDVSGESTRSNSCGSGTGTLIYPDMSTETHSVRSTVYDSCNAVTVILEDPYFGFFTVERTTLP